jgi:exodeoxyribonuclease V beta subunit
VLRNALREFDEASIYTIHGFCQRMLAEFAFESGSLFNTELAADQQEMLRGAVEDYWRVSALALPEYCLRGCTGR